MHRISARGLDFIKGFESFVPYVYDDLRPPVRGRYAEWHGEPPIGTLTIGYGHTNAAKHPLKIKLGLRITEAEAAEILDVDLDECEQDVDRLVKVPISQGQFDALVSFTFNCGAGNLKKLITRLNRGDYAGTRRAFDAYVKSKGRTLRGLQRRRDGEQVLWDADIPPPAPAEPLNQPEQVDTPKTSEPPSSMATSTEGNAALVSTGTGGIGIAQEVSTAMSKVAASGKPFTVAEFLLQLSTSLTFWAAVIAVATGAYLWFRRRARLIEEHA